MVLYTSVLQSIVTNIIALNPGNFVKQIVWLIFALCSQATEQDMIVFSAETLCPLFIRTKKPGQRVRDKVRERLSSVTYLLCDPEQMTKFL